MKGGRPEPVVEGALPSGLIGGALPEVDGLSTTGFSAFIDRALGLICVVALLPALLTSQEQMHQLNPIWLMCIGGAALASAVLMPVYAWSRRGIRPLVILFSATVLIGMLTWRVAWTGSETEVHAPLLALVLGLGVVCAGVASTTLVGALYGLVIGVAFWLVRLTPSGASSSPIVAFQDAVLVVGPPIAVLIVLQQVRAAMADLDAQLARRHAESADAAVNQALVDERRRLDAIVHDEIMTTLVAAAGSRTQQDPHVAKQAQHAIEALRVEASLEQADSPITVDQFVRLAKDITGSVCPRAQVIGEIPAVTVTLPQRVVRPMLQAIREAALNAEKHSSAETVQVYAHVTASGRRIAVRVSIADDGKGFDPAAVPAERLGVRLALEGRMLAIGGRAEILAAPGRGTTIRLMWSGDRMRAAAVRRSLSEIALQHPLFLGMDPKPVTIVGLALAALYFGIAALNAAHSSPALVAAAVALLAGGFALVRPALLRGPIPWWIGWLAAAGAVGAAAAALAAMPDPSWGEHCTWFLVPEVVLLVLTYAGGQVVPVWAAVAAHTVIAALAAWQTGQPVGLSLATIAGPALWLTLTSVIFRWLNSIWAEIDDAEQSGVEAAQLNASFFSKLVLREVWLTELREEVGPVLDKLAAGTPLSAADRADFLLLEGSLRDGIKASNFNSPGLSAAIMEARTRGVGVTLVDNRGSRLPEPARRATLRHLERIVREAGAGRIVARTAPEGYDDAVTIVQVLSPDETSLTRIAPDGTVVAVVGVPAAEYDPKRKKLDAH